MKSLQRAIESLVAQLPEVEQSLGAPDVVSDRKKFKELSIRYSYLSDVSTAWVEYEKLTKDLKGIHALLKEEKDEEMREIAESEREELERQIEALGKRLKELLIPPDPNDHASTILEIRAGTGGDEAALFVGDVVRMYKLYADANRWKYELLASSPSELGGFREYIMVISGKNVHRFLQFEGGTHRVQRVPDTETQGRVHTSAITIAVLIEPPESEEVPIDEKDLRIDTYRSSGAGGQHVNTTDSAVRITHVPTGTVVYCQEERSQIKNRAKAMRLLRAKLVEIEERKHMESMASKRQSQVGSGDRSERIRTYNFPQNRVTDHRINLTLYSLDRVMEGELVPFSTALLEKHYESQIDAAQNQPSL